MGRNNLRALEWSRGVRRRHGAHVRYVAHLGCKECLSSAERRGDLLLPCLDYFGPSLQSNYCVAMGPG